jgi:hypothetical protein
MPSAADAAGERPYSQSAYYSPGKQLLRLAIRKQSLLVYSTTLEKRRTRKP